MPVFRATPSRDLGTSIRRAMASSNMGPLAEIQADMAAAQTAHHLGLAEKARAEVEALRRQSDPEAISSAAAAQAGINDPERSRMENHIRGVLEQPAPADVDDAMTIGKEAQPYVTGKPTLEAGQENIYRKARAAIMLGGVATGHSNAEQLAKAAGNLQQNDVQQRVQDAIARGDAYGASAMQQGNHPGTAINLHHNIGDTGATYAPSTGEVTADPANPLLASTLAARKALADKRTATTPPAAASPEAPATDKTGDEYLGQLPSDMQKTIKAVAEGRTPLTHFSTKGGHREAVLRMVMQYDPTYNATRANAWKEFTTGGQAKNIVAINTAIGHMGTLDELASVMDNKDPKIVNRVVNAISTQLGKPEVNNFETARQAVGEELMRTFRQVGASEHEAAAWAKRFDSSNSPEQLKGAIKTAAELLNSRINAVDDQWKRATQSKTGFPDLLSPKSAEVMKKLSGKAPAGPASTNAKGWKLMVDGQGNKAYVSPDGKEFEELK